ncbi:MAG: hypothetical protein JWM78_1373 [Verrucomicrobiaceae bacterium]|nr:hypothetical protein [Verrucomicrobiaceae bacterium]
MRLSALLLTVFFSTVANSYPVNYAFTGEVTAFNLNPTFGFSPTAIDPKAPLFGEDGTKIYNGDPAAFGQFTIDIENLPAPYTCGNRKLGYSMSTEGASYNLKSGIGCVDSVVANKDTIAWHVEGPRLTNSGGLESSIQDFAFNFSNGNFIGGTFNLNYMFENGYYGGISGVINNLSAVPEPASISLLFIGMIGIALTRKRML